MLHLGTVKLETERLLLVRFEKKDAIFMFNNWAKNKNVTKFLTWNAHKSIEETESVIDNWLQSYIKDNFYHWAIVYKEINEPIGSISVVEQDEEKAQMILGYVIGEKWWGKGIVPEAYSKVIEFLFNEIKVKKIIGRHDVENVNSGKVMLKCGLKYLRTDKKAGSNNANKTCDLCIYEINNKF